MKQITANKKTLVMVPKDQQVDGIIAFQLVEFVVDFYGKKITSVLDTKIDQDGTQTVIDGDGYIPAGFAI